MSHKSSRAMMVGLIATLLAGPVAVPVAATTAKITGTLVLPADVSGPGTGAIAVITLIDATNTSDSGNIIGEQRIDGIGATPVAFAVPFEADTINPDHAYAVFATVVDGTSVWQNPTGVPVITGGPVEGVKIPIPPFAAGDATITVRTTVPSGTTFGPSAVGIAALIKRETGTLVSRQILPTMNGDLPTFEPTPPSAPSEPPAPEHP